MEAIIRIFSDHYTAMILDCENQVVIGERNFGMLFEAREWLNARGFKDDAIGQYDWRITESTPATETL